MLRSILSSRDQDEIDNLTQAFNRFQKQFDRGLVVQSGAMIEKSGATLETLLADIGMFHTCVHQLFGMT